MKNTIKNIEALYERTPALSALAYTPIALLLLLLLFDSIWPIFGDRQYTEIVLFVIVFISMASAWKLSRTIQKQAKMEIELHQSKILLESFFEKSPAIMFVKNLDGQYHLANQSFRDFADDNDADLVEQGVTNVFPDDSAISAMAEQDVQVIEKKQAMEFFSKWPGLKDNRYFSILRFPLFDDVGEVIAVCGIATDNTEQVLAKKALKDSEDQFRALVDSAPDAVLVASKSGRIMLANRQAENLFAYGKDELLNRSLKSLMPDIDMRIADHAHSQDGTEKSPINLQSMFAVDSGKLAHPVEVSTSLTRTESGTTITCLIRDVSDRAELESQLRHSQKMEALGKLTGGMAHDFNNLLGVIMGNLDLAAKKLEEDSPILKRLDTARKASERGAELTRRMLAVARRQPLQPKPTNISSALEELADMLPRTLGAEIEMKTDIKEDLPDVLIDPSGLENVFLNLAINSRDAMPNGGKFYITTEVLHLTPENPLAMQEDMHLGSYVQIVVTDTGEGMNQETLARVFEPFFTTKEHSKGTGLGLSMIYGFAKQSGGSVRIYSELGVGTTIDIFLPVSDEKAGEKQSEAKGENIHLKNLGATKILVVDDEYELLEVAVSYLEDLGFDVLAATDAAQALHTVDSNPDIEFLLTDIVMPGGIDGTELAKTVRERLPKIKVLYMSGFPSGVFLDRTGTNLDAPLITKPYSREGLSVALNDLIQSALDRA